MTGMHQGLSAAAPFPRAPIPPLSKEELSTLQRSGTFYFALTGEMRNANRRQYRRQVPHLGASGPVTSRG